MSIHDHDLAVAYIKAEPFTIFDPLLAAILAQVGWDKMSNGTDAGRDNYSIANCVSGFKSIDHNQPRLSIGGLRRIAVEFPDFDRLRHFYDEHGLEPLASLEIEANQVLNKLQQALALLEIVEPVASCIRELVKTILVLRQDDPEIDTSYSHPEIPFSIFVTVCEDDSMLSSLRVAESILHETMHLQLTLLENTIELVRPNTASLYFSPWRDEDRPIRGVLHGLYVFRAIHDFYATLIKTINYSGEIDDFLSYRIKSIKNEITMLSDFGQIDSLTVEGKSFSNVLLNFKPKLC